MVRGGCPAGWQGQWGQVLKCGCRLGKFSVGKILAFGWRWYVGEQQLASNSMRLARCAVLLEVFVFDCGERAGLKASKTEII